jgi:t-SNARE complex subunit (syntaxin)
MNQPMNPPPSDLSRVELTLEELYQIVGELEVMRRKQQQMIATLTKELAAKSEPPK